MGLDRHFRSMLNRNQCSDLWITVMCYFGSWYKGIWCFQLDLSSHKEKERKSIHSLKRKHRQSDEMSSLAFKLSFCFAITAF